MDRILAGASFRVGAGCPILEGILYFGGTPPQVAFSNVNVISLPDFPNFSHFLGRPFCW